LLNKILQFTSIACRITSTNFFSGVNTLHSEIFYPALHYPKYLNGLTMLECCFKKKPGLFAVIAFLVSGPSACLPGNTGLRLFGNRRDSIGSSGVFAFAKLNFAF